jgi:hypothetical protein
MKISIIDIQGNSKPIEIREIDEGQSSVEVDMTNFSNGFYYLIIENGVAREVIKLIKK